MKTIDTLVQDIEAVLKGYGGWDAACTHFLAETCGDVATSRFMGTPRAHNTLTLSGIGQGCKRKLWLKVNSTELGEPLAASMHLKFFYGDLVENMILALAIAAGHRVEGMQDRLDADGIKGHRDAVIDGVTIDVKSCSSYSFKKFKEGGLRYDDPFGYISQLSSYVYGGKDDPLVLDKERGAFLVMDKVHGHIHLDVHNFKQEIINKPKEIEDVKAMVANPIPPDRLDTVADGKSGNRKLCMQCSYCDRKHSCFDGIRTFQSYKGPVYFSEVVKEPRMKEITSGN